MKRAVVLLVLFCLVFASALSDKDVSTTLGEAAEATGEKLGDIGRNSNVYAEALGENLLKFQELFIGVLGFASLGFLDGSGDMDFVTFLFFILLFMVIYSIVGFVFDKFNFGIAFVITLLAFIGMPEESLRAILLNYEAMGVAITVILPILILLSFTFRIYYKAYMGKSETSPFYAEMFNMVFLIFFGVFFMRHSGSEEGVIAVMRFASGIGLIVLGVGQTVLYKIGAKMFNDARKEEKKIKREEKKMRQDAADKMAMQDWGIVTE